MNWEPVRPLGNASNCVQYPILRNNSSGRPGGMPSTSIVPREGRMRPAIRFMSVVLPEPFGPTRLVMPGGMERVIPAAKGGGLEDPPPAWTPAPRLSSHPLRAANLARQQVEAEAADRQQGQPAAPDGGLLAMHAEEDRAGAAMHWLFKQ